MVHIIWVYAKAEHKTKSTEGKVLAQAILSGIIFVLWNSISKWISWHFPERCCTLPNTNSMKTKSFAYSYTFRRTIRAHSKTSRLLLTTFLLWIMQRMSVKEIHFLHELPPPGWLFHSFRFERFNCQTANKTKNTETQNINTRIPFQFRNNECIPIACAYI